MAARGQRGQKVRRGHVLQEGGSIRVLVKTAPDNRQSRLGPRDEKAEETLRAFTERKRAIESRQRSLQGRLHESERLNRALRVGRAPNVVVNVLNELEHAELGSHFTVVGTHALYAYETAASVRIVAGALATQDADPLWGGCKRAQFVSAMAKLDGSLLKRLQRADPSFQRMGGQLESVVNDKGFRFDFFPRVAVDGDLWPDQAERAESLLNAPGYEVVVFSVTGRMALMRTVSPAVFVALKRWMAELDERPAGKRRRDSLQADIVQQLLDEKALQP